MGFFLISRKYQKTDFLEWSEYLDVVVIYFLNDVRF